MSESPNRRVDGTANDDKGQCSTAREGGVSAGQTLFVGSSSPANETVGAFRCIGRPSTYLLLFYLGLVDSCAPVHLLTRRVARRFAGRGLAICVGLAAEVGPSRDYAVAAIFPEWIVFAPGLVPALAVAATYAGFVALGYAVVRLVSGPADEDC